MPPKRKAEAIDETEVSSPGEASIHDGVSALMVSSIQETTNENNVPVFSYNTHYSTLYLDFSHRIPYTPEVFTYEGVRLCHNCLQKWHSRRDNTSRVAGTECRDAAPKFGKPCDSCKMPLKFRSHDKRNHLQVSGKNSASACEIATSLGATEDTWKPHGVWKSLICPGCKMPGFNVDSLRDHFRENECVGKKEYMERVRKTPSTPKQPVKCPRCEYWFRPSILGIHVCGSDLDPVWLGKQERLPDISKPYVVWGHELPPPHGPTSFGGGYRYEDSQGVIPVKVLENSWAAPFASSSRFRDECIQTEDLCGLIRAVKHLLADQDVVEALNNSPNAQVISEKIQTMRTEFERLNRIRNESLLQRCRITYGQVKGADKCPGFAWRHGSFDCRHGSSINLGTVTLIIKYHNKTLILEQSCCAYCKWDSSAISNWTRYSKFNGEGERLCTRPNCLEILKTSIDCEKHVQERRERMLAHQETRLIRKQNELEERQTDGFGRARGRHLWRIVSREDIGSFFSNLTDAQFSALDDDWRSVKSSVTDRDYHGPSIFYIDTESSRILDQQEESMKTLVPFELAVLDHLGNIIVNTTIDYGRSVADLMQGCPQQFTAKACAIYGLKDSSGKTCGMTPAQLREKLRASGLNKDSILVEHSSSNWDQRALAAICKDDTPQRTLPTLQLLTSLQYHGPRDLQTLFLVAWPNSRLKALHHRALWDTSKLLMIMRCLFSRNLTEEPVTAEFFKQCLSFEDVAHSRSNNVDSSTSEQIYGGDEWDPEEESGESDWDASELDDAD